MKRVNISLCKLVSIFLIIGICVLGGCTREEQSVKQNTFDQIVSKGYSGSEEQLLASIVGEQADPAKRGKTAYEMAVDMGYRGSFQEWMLSLTGYEETDKSKTVFQVMVDNGFNGSLQEYLSSLVPDAEKLGYSTNGDEASEYEIALLNGYEGSYVEWLCFLIHQ